MKTPISACGVDDGHVQFFLPNQIHQIFRGTFCHVERMSQFIQEVTTKNIFIRRLHPETRGLFTGLAPYCKLPMKLLLSNLWLFGGLLTKVLPKLNATAGGMVGTTCNFQTIEGSVNSKECTASVMFRNVNEEDLKADYAAFKAVADKYGITLETERDGQRRRQALSYLCEDRVRL